MQLPRFRVPSPSLLLAGVALFMSLGGTGYALTRSGSGAPHAHAAATKQKPLTKKQVQALIASYVKAHSSRLRGPQGVPGLRGLQGVPGASGAPGAKGDTGSQGPGAIPLTASLIGTNSQQLATLGPWTLTLNCSTGAPNAQLRITGPGTITGTSILSSGGTTTTLGSSAIGAGNNSNLTNGQTMSQTAYLQSGSTLYQVNDWFNADNSGLFETCTFVGDAIPVPAAG